MKVSSWVIYIGIAIFFGCIFAVGVNWMTYKPQPLQVPLIQYQPASPPQPAVPNIAPTVKTTDPFAPAPAPVIVTTAPLPTITPSGTPVPDRTVVNASCTFPSEVASAYAGINGMFPFFFVFGGVLVFMSLCTRSTGTIVLIMAFLMLMIGWFVMGNITSSITVSMPC